MKVGFIGFSKQEFDVTKARTIIKHVFDIIEKGQPKIVSGLTSLGIPLLVYEEAYKRGLYTVGIACSKAKEFPCWKVDETVIVGDEWGDESIVFLTEIDMLIKIGGGEQSKKEFADFSKLKFNFDL